MDESTRLQAIHLIVVLGVALLIGVERERDQTEREKGALRQFGGVRTFPIIALAGYLLSPHPWAYTAGLLVLGGLLVVSYQHKIHRGRVGFTTEVTALVTYAIGPIVQMGTLWLAVASGIITVLLLQLKQPMERLARRLPGEEIFTFTQFVLLTAVILPLLPDQPFTPFELNPFRAWLVVVAITSISYLSYLLQQWRGNRQGVLVAALLGGIYSSTSTTVALARQGREQPAQVRMTTGAIVLATGVMYIRLVVLISLFAPGLGRALLWPFAAMALLALAVGGFWIQRQERMDAPRLSLGNPLQLRHALIFAGLFIGIQVITRLALQGLGNTGLYTLAGIMGLTDIDPFILSLTQQTTLAVRQGALAVGLAIASNNLFKGIYAWRIGGTEVGRRALVGLVSLGVLTVVAVAGFVR